MNEEELTDLEKFELIIQDCKEHRRLYNESFVSEDDIEIMETVLNLLEKKDKIIDYMATAISNYDSQLVINTYENKQHVKEVFEEYYNYKIEKGE